MTSCIERDTFWRLDEDGTLERMEAKRTDFEPVNEEMIGKGSFSEVYQFRHKSSGNIVACKCYELKHEYEQISHANRELMFLPNIECENLVAYRGYIPLKMKLFIFMELMDISFSKLLKYNESNWKFPEVACWAFLKQTANGLRYIHEKGYMHRDIKPSNILFSVEDGSVKLADFGTVKDLSRSAPYTEALSRWDEEMHNLATAPYTEEAGVGRAHMPRMHTKNPATAPYTAPEALFSCPDSPDYEARYSESCDVWSLAISTIELSMGAHPIVNNQEFLATGSSNSVEWLYNRLKVKEDVQKFEIVRQRDLGVSTPLYQLLSECLNKVSLDCPDQVVVRPSAQQIHDAAVAWLCNHGNKQEKEVMRDWFKGHGYTISKPDDSQSSYFPDFFNNNFLTTSLKGYFQ